MKYSCEIEIDKPLPRVLELFDDPDNIGKWMEGLVRFTPIEGTPGQVGAVSELEFDFKGRKMLLVETITERDLPRAFSATYDTTGSFNTVRNSFRDLGGRTGWTCESEFRFSGLMRVIGFLMPGEFKKQSLKFMAAFKAFAERS
jgi:hypothetical protein